MTLTRIARGETDPSLFWTAEVLIPSTSPDPDAPPRSLSGRASAEQEVERLRAKGFDARVERVDQPGVADVPAGVLGYRVRVGSFPGKAGADVEKARLAAAGVKVSSAYTGCDGDPADRGPWRVNVLTIDPRMFSGKLVGSFGPDLEQRETTSQLARLGHATAAVNSGFLVMDPMTGAEGDPCGRRRVRRASALRGRQRQTEPDSPRRRSPEQHQSPHLGRTRDQRRPPSPPRWHRPHARVIRNCGGDGTDQPTAEPLHDFTCTDNPELVAFTPEFEDLGTPSGPGREVVVADGTVVAVHYSRGATRAAGQTSGQATGSEVDRLAGVRVGDELRVRLRLTAGGSDVATPPGTTVTNGGPLLVRDGQEEITQRRDGFVHPDYPSFAYGWFVKRNPRTIAGIDARGRTVLVTVDGRTDRDLGLSIPEAADVARSLGLVDAVNLSTAVALPAG